MLGLQHRKEKERKLREEPRQRGTKAERAPSTAAWRDGDSNFEGFVSGETQAGEKRPEGLEV
jgi:hypothetical protein